MVRHKHANVRAVPCVLELGLGSELASAWPQTLGPGEQEASCKHHISRMELPGVGKAAGRSFS